MDHEQRKNRRAKSLKEVRLHNKKHSHCIHVFSNSCLLMYCIAAFVFCIIQLTWYEHEFCSRKARDMIIVFLVRTGVLGGICGFTSLVTALSRKPHGNLLHCIWLPFNLACAIYCIIIFSWEYKYCNSFQIYNRGYSAMVWILIDSCFVILWIGISLCLVVSALLGICVCGMGCCLFAVHEANEDQNREKVFRGEEGKQ